MSAKKIIIVLGMHRSGTSALTRALDTLGVSLGSNLHPAGPDNPTGFWEDSDVIALNNELLTHLNSAHDLMGVVEPDLFSVPSIVESLEHAKQLLLTKTTGLDVWGMKDPRIARLLPYWSRVLGELGWEVGYVIALRNPLNVAASLAVRNHMPSVKAYVLWLEHMLQAVAHSARHKRLVVEYDELLEAPRQQLERIAAALELVPPTQEAFKTYAEEFLDTGLRHGNHDAAELVALEDDHPLLVRTYRLLHECSLDRLSLDSTEFESRLAPLMTELKQMATLTRLTTAAELAHVMANQGIVERDTRLIELAARLNEATLPLPEMNLEWVTTQAELVALVSERDELLAEREEVLSRQQSLRKKIEEAQLAHDQLLFQNRDATQAIQQFTVQNEALSQQLLAISEHAAAQRSELQLLRPLQERLLEQVEVLARAWRSFFSLRAWRMLNMVAKDKALPRVTLADGVAFDEAFYLQAYPDVAQSGLSPVIHFLCNGVQEGRLGSPAVPSFADVTALERDLSDDAPLEGSQGSVIRAEPAARIAPDEVADSVVFDPEFYLAMYADIAASEVDPELHFINHGQFEGRLGCVPAIRLSRPLDTFDPLKQTVLLVSHEASRTGAPVLSLNITERLTQNFNVVVLLFGGGPLLNAFSAAGASVAGPISRAHPVAVQWALNAFLDSVKFEFAIVNSLDSYLALQPLAERFIPTVSLIHEFAVYTRPRVAIQNALLWASQTVFSADVTLESAALVIPELRNCELAVLPQGKSEVPGEMGFKDEVSAEKARLHHAIRPRGEADDSIVILGAGRVQIRKGVDLFIECATRVLNSEVGSRCRFVWIGDNYDPEVDIAYSVYLFDQIQRAGIADRFSVITETALIQEVYSLSDMLVVTSRLDPLPNVAIDALMCGLPVLCFDRTTGIADILTRHGLGDPCVAQYLDTADMAMKVIALASSDAERTRVGSLSKEVALQVFDMPAYVDKLVDMADRHVSTLQLEWADTVTIAESELFDPGYYPPAGLDLHDALTASRRYVRSWSRGILRRKFFPGFNPAVYQDLNRAAVGPQDPLAHYLRAGRPEGVWDTQHLDWREVPFELIKCQSRLYLSVASTEQLAAVLKKLDDSFARVDVVLLVPDEATSLMMSQWLKAELQVPMKTVVSRGCPMQTMLAHLSTSSYKSLDMIGHIDMAIAPPASDFTSSSAYHHYVLENLVGGIHPALKAIGWQFTGAQGTPLNGLVFPEDPNLEFLPAEASLLSSLCDALGFPRPASQHASYPVNGAFWAVPGTLIPLVENIPVWTDFLESQKADVRSRERILTRLLPQACARGNMGVSTTVVSGVTY
ncbi:glycosyltransferase [Pseudomonas sp. dw_358]|uniref:glycosyltransferase n=1 Tax=Pseudomonas sp. dw_358 TaxID=2720083 RepID=UPI001BD64E54|nr:glycosyltransferase [Pseudomonas sp. dw_358]